MGVVSQSAVQLVGRLLACGPVLRRGVVLAFLWLAACVAIHAAETPAVATHPATFSLNLVVPSHRLPALTASVMKQELARIWAREGVEIVWRQRESDVPAGSPFLSLTLIDDEERPHRTQDKYVLGDFLQDEGRIRISLFAAAQTALKSAGPSRRFRENYERPLAVGYVLGRAIAHEIGHALLGKSHTESGLMMAIFEPATMADAMSDRFRLTDPESVRLSLSRVSVRGSARESAFLDPTPASLFSLKN